MTAHAGETKTVLVIGNGKAAIDFVEILRGFVPATPSDTAARLGLVLVDGSNTDPWTTSLSEHCQRHGISHLTSNRFNASEIVEAVRAVKPVLAFSVNNHQILRPEFLALPREGVVNFHNSPLPRYGGLNACTWALVNGEREHGVTLHYLDQGVDTGDIIGQTRFPIGDEMTALQLIMRCLQEGAQLFRRMLPEILNGTVQRTAQDGGQRSFYKKREIPNDGRADFSWPYRKLHDFVRGLNFHPLQNPLAYPRAEFRGRPFYLDRIGWVESSVRHPPGTVVEAAGGRLCVQVQDAVVRLLQVRDEGQNRVPVATLMERFGIEAGTEMAA